MDDTKPHLVKQVNHFSDGSEQVINYRGVVQQDGSVALDKPEEYVETPISEEPIEESSETPTEEASDEEVAEDIA